MGPMVVTRIEHEKVSSTYVVRKNAADTRLEHTHVCRKLTRLEEKLQIRDYYIFSISFTRLEQCNCLLNIDHYSKE